MKNYLYLFLICLTLFTCEEVVDLNLKTAEPRLVIDASLNWIKDTDGKNQYIKLTLTAPYYDIDVPSATGASVEVTDKKNNTFIFNEEGNTGIYRNINFIPEIDGVYNLKIQYKNEVYIGTESLKPVVPIESIEQKNNGGFSGKDTEIKAFYTDPKNIKNYYLFDFINPTSNVSSLNVYDDEFTDGNRIFAFHSDDKLKPGQELIIQNYGISKQYFEFMNILLQQSNDESGDPFQSQPATIRGNCINQTKPENFPFGYFRVSEVDVYNYTIQ